MIRKQSIVTVRGKEKSYVDISELNIDSVVRITDAENYDASKQKPGTIVYNTTEDKAYVVTTDGTLAEVGSTVTPIDSTDEITEPYKIYYDTVTGGLYISMLDNQSNVVFGKILTDLDEHWQVANAPEIITTGTAPSIQTINVIKPRVLYTGGFQTDGAMSPVVIVIRCDTTNISAGAHEFAFRIAIDAEGTVPGIVFTGDYNVIVPDAVQEILDDMEAGHTYEFNIFHHYLAVMDITYTT